MGQRISSNPDHGTDQPIWSVPNWNAPSSAKARDIKTIRVPINQHDSLFRDGLNREQVPFQPLVEKDTSHDLRRNENIGSQSAVISNYD